jgi:hypothetical protein
MTSFPFSLMLKCSLAGIASAVPAFFVSPIAAFRPAAPTSSGGRFAVAAPAAPDGAGLRRSSGKGQTVGGEVVGGPGPRSYGRGGASSRLVGFDGVGVTGDF